jgi:hypothetical protein
MDPVASHVAERPASDDEGDLERERFALLQRIACVTELRIIRVLANVLCLCLGIPDL